MRLRGTWLVLLLLAALLGSVRPALADTLTVADYWQLLADAQQALLAGDDVSALADRLAAVSALSDPDGTQRPIDTTYWVAQLRDVERDRAQLADELAAQIAAQTAAGSLPPGPDPQSALDAVLARAEFDYAPESENWRERLWRRFVSWLLDLLDPLFGVLPSRSSGWFAFAIFALVIAALLYVWLRGVRRGFVPERSVAAANPFDVELTADEARDLARRHAEAREYREAVRYLYLAALLTLDERDLLRFDRSKTNREYLRALLASVTSAGLEPTLRAAVDRFDRVWYGFEPIDAAGYAQYEATIAALIAAQPEVTA